MSLRNHQTNRTKVTFTRTPPRDRPAEVVNQRQGRTYYAKEGAESMVRYGLVDFNHLGTQRGRERFLILKLRGIFLTKRREDGEVVEIQ